MSYVLVHIFWEHTVTLCSHLAISQISTTYKKEPKRYKKK